MHGKGVNPSSDEENSEHAQPREVIGSHCVDSCGSMTAGNIRFLGSSFLSLHWTVDGSLRINSETGVLIAFAEPG